MREKLKAILSRALSYTNTLELLGASASQLDCNALEERVLLSASPLPILVDVDGIDSLGFDGGFDDLSEFDDAFHAFNTELDGQSPIDNESAPGQLVIIDADVQDADLLITDLERQLADGASLWVELLDANEDGIDQVTDLLERYENLAALHVVSHGEQGALQLGNTRLAADSLDGYAGDIVGWADALSSDADILIYGCDVAGSVDGQLLVSAVSELTGADVAASADITGHNYFTGDWELEFEAGTIETGLVFSLDVQHSWLGLLSATETGGVIDVNSHLPDTQETNDTGGQAVATNSAGDFVVVWQSTKQDVPAAGDYGVFAQLFDANGDPVGSEIPINDYVAKDQIDPSVAMADDGSFVIVWASKDQDGQGFEVYGMRFDATGNPQQVPDQPVGTFEFRVNDYITDDQLDPAVSMDGDGNFVVTWTSFDQAGTGSKKDVYFRRFDKDGNVLDNQDVLVNTQISFDQYDSSVDMNDSGDFVVSWTASDNQDGDGFGVYAQKFDNTGGVIGAEISVTTEVNNDQFDASIGIDAAGRFVVVWAAENHPVEGDNLGIMAQLFDTTTARIGDEIVVNNGAVIGNQINPSVDMTASGDFVVTWTDAITKEIYYQEFSAAGTAQDQLLKVDIDDTVDQSKSSAAIQDDGDFIVIWTGDGLPVYDDHGVFAQQFAFDNEAPVLDLPGLPLNFFENDPPMIIDGGAVATDVDSANFDGGRLVIDFLAGGTANDRLAINNEGTLPGEIGVSGSNVTFGGTTIGSFTGGVGSTPLEITLNSNATVAATQALARNITYEDLPNDTDTFDRTVRFILHDGDGGTSDPVTQIISITHVNDAPDIQGITSKTITEDTTIQFDNGDLIQIVDVDADTSELRLSLSVSHGVINLNSTNNLTFYEGTGDGQAYLVFSGAIDDINNALDNMAYAPTPLYIGTDQLIIHVDDQGNTGAGGPQTDDHIVDITINADGVNDAPTNIKPGNETIIEDEQLVFSTENGNRLWVQDDAGGNDIQVTLEVLNGAVPSSDATLTLSQISELTFFEGDGSADSRMRFQGTVDEINDALDGLLFEPNTGFTGQLMLQIFTEDLGHQGAGGPETDLDTITIDVDERNDPPAITAPATVSTVEGNPFTFDGANPIDIVDPDATGDIQVSLSTDHGTITLGSTAGLTFVSGSDNSSSMTVKGNQGEIDAALDNLVYTPDPGYAGPDNFQISVDDLGGVGAGGAQADLHAIFIDVTPDGSNADPVNNVPPMQNTDEETSLELSNRNSNLISINDDAGQDLIKVTLEVNDGTLTLSNTVGIESAINAFTPGDQELPQVAMDESGNYVVVWQSNGQDGSGKGIYAQLFNANGAKTGPEFLVNESTAGDQQEPVVAMDKNGNFVVSWTGKGDNGADSKAVYTRLFDKDGNDLSGGEVLVNQFVANDQATPAVAMNWQTGDFVITWQTKEQIDEWDIYARQFSFDLLTIGNEFQVNDSTVKKQTDPAVDINDSGDFIIAWESNLLGDGNHEVLYRRFDATGTAIDIVDQLANDNSTKNQLNATVALDDSGNYAVAWQSQDQDYTDDKYGIYAQIWDNTGTEIKNEFVVNNTFPKDQLNPSISMDSNGDFIVAWQSKSADKDVNFEVYAKRYDITGNEQGDEFLVNLTSNKDQRNPHVALNRDGDFVMVWQSTGQDTADSEGIFGQQYRDIRSLTFYEGDGFDDNRIVVEGTLDQINDALDGLVYTPNTDFVGTDTLTITTDDQHTTDPRTDVDSFDIVIDPINDAPTIDVPGLQIISQDTSLTFVLGVNEVSIGDVDDPSVIHGVTVIGNHGDITLFNIGGLTALTGNGTSLVTLSGTLADINAALDGMQFDPTTGFAGSASIFLRVDDPGEPAVGDELSGADTVFIQVDPDLINNAPTIDLPDPQRTDKNVDLFLDSNGGNVVSISDDSDSGIIEVTVTVTNGTVTLSDGTTGDVNEYVVDTGNQTNADIGIFADGSFVTVWESPNQDGNGTAIVAQRFSSQGQAMGDEFVVNSFVTGNQIEAAVATSANGNFVVTWQSPQDGGGNGVYGQLYDNAGIAVGSEFIINTTTASEQRLVDVAMADDGSFVAVWQSGGNLDGNGEGIFAQRFDSNAVSIGDEFRVNTTTVGNQTVPAIAMSGATGDFIVVWQDDDNNLEGIFAQRFDKDGNAVGNQFLVNTTTLNDQKTPDVAMDDAGGFVVVWETTNEDSAGKGIAARVYDGNGFPQGSGFLVNDFTAGNQTAPRVSMNASTGEFVVLWQSPNQDGDGESVAGQRFDATGAEVGGEFIVNSDPTGNQELPSVAMNKNGEIVAAFTGVDGNNDGVFVKKLLANNALQFLNGDGQDDTFIKVRGTVDSINAALDGMLFTPDFDFLGTATIDLSVDDLGNSGGGSLTAQESLDIIVGDLALVDLDADDSSGGVADTYETAFTIGGGPIPAVDALDAIIDVNGNPLTTDLHSLTVRITNLMNPVTESLSLSSALPGTLSLDSSTPGQLVITGVDTVAVYESVLRSVEYDNTSITPDRTARMIEFFVTDDNDDPSNIAIATIHYPNTTPTDINPDSFLREDGTDTTGGVLLGTLTAADPDPSETATFEIVGGLDAGKFTIGGVGEDELYFDDGVLDIAVQSSYSVNVRVTDSLGAFHVEALTVDVDPNDDPVATNNVDAIPEDTASPVTGNVLTDDDGFGVDSDPESNPIMVSQIDGLIDPAIDISGSYGTLDWDTDGSYSYTLDNGNAAVQALAVGETLTDAFTYTVSDGNGGTDTATLTITIDGANDGPTATANANTIAEDTVAAVGGNVLSDDDGFGVDSDVDTSDTLSVDQIDGEMDPLNDVVGLYGTLDWDTNGSYSYTLDNGNAAVQALAVGETLTDVFTYTVSDGNGGTDTAALTITIDGVNDDPLLVRNATLSVATGGTRTITSSLLEASDVDNPPAELTYTVTGGLANGWLELTTAPTVPISSFTQAQINANEVVYIHDGSPSVTDSITLDITDAQGGSLLGVVFNITIQDEIVALPDFDSTDEATAISISAPGMLGNDTNVNPDYTPDFLSLNYDTQEDTDGDIFWEDTTNVIGYNWDFFGSGVTRTTTPTNAPLGIGAAYEFSGGGGGIMPSLQTLFGDPSDNSASFEIWFNPSSSPGQEVLVEFGTVGGGTSLTLNGTTLEFLVDDGPAIGLLTADLSSEIAADQYIQVVGVIERAGPSSNLELYVNGSVVDSDVVAGLFDWDEGFQAGLGQADGLINSTNMGNFQGEIGILRFYETDLTAAEIQANYDAVTTSGLTVTSIDTSGTAGLVGFLPDGSYTYDPNGQFESLAVGESTTDTFTYTVSDGTTTAVETVTITVNGRNDASSATSNTNTITEDDVPPATGNLITDDDGFGVDSDIDDNDILSVAQIDGETDPLNDVAGLYGTLDWDTNGSYSYTLDNANPAVQALAVGETLTDTFTYTVSDGNGSTDTETLTVTINGVNDDPIANDDSGAAFTTDEDTPFAATLGLNDLLLNDADLDGDTLTVNTTPISGPSNGTLVLNSDGTFTYTPNLNFNGSDSFVYEVSDGNGGTAQATVTITVNPINDDPVANDDTFTTDEDMPFSATLGLDDLLLNDSDLDGDSLTVNTTPVSGPTNGSVVLNSDGTFTYTPSLNFNGSDSFVYEVSDGNGGTAQATVNVTVNPINDNPVANVDAFTTDEDTPYSATLGLDDLLLNDSDLDGDSLTVNTTPISGPSNGTVVLSSDGTFTYTPNLNFNGSDSFVYEVSDGNGGAAQATVNVTVNPINDNPVANVDAFTTDEDTPFSATLGVDDLLLNDSDLDGDSLTVNTTPVSGPTNGSVVLNSDGTFTYTPSLNFNGSDSFVYEVSDGNGGTAQATVNITVNPINDNPVANVDAFTTDEDTPYSATLGLDDLLLNDSDLDGDSLTVNTTQVSGPTNGSVVLNSDGTFTYTPSLNFNGSDSFVYEVSDGNGGTAQATVNVTVNPINDNPVANVDGFTTDEDTPFSATLGLDDLLLNDSDLDGDSLTVNSTPVSGPTNGSVVLNSDGTFTYTPNLNFNGSDSFVYEVSDGNGGTAQATVNVTVNSINDNPVANVDAFTTDEDAPYSATLGLDDLLLNDSDLDGDSLTVNTTPVSGPTNGSVVLNSGGTFTYTPSLNFNGSDSFVYEVSDGNGGTAQATVNVTVNPINDNPVANVDAFTTDEDTPFSATLGLDDLLLNDSDLDGDSLTVNTTPVSGPTNGLVVLNSDGTFTYTPNLNFNGSDSFVYEVSDGNGGTAQATVNVTVNPINDDPVANVDGFTTDEDTPYSATLGLDDLLLNDSDLDGDSLTVNTTPVSGPTNGALVLSSDGTFTYTPNLNFNGSDSFVYEVSDGNGGTAQATVNITVNPINDDPVANDDAFTTDEDTPFSATLGLDDLLLNDSDLDGDSLTVNTTPVSGPTNGSVVLNSDGTFTYTPSLNFNGSDSFVYEVSDGNGGTAQATVNVTVNSINDNPVANVDAFTTDEDTPYSATLGLDDLLLNDSDLDGDSLTVNTTPVSGPTNGLVVLNSDGTFTYTPNLNFNGSDSFVYEVSDGNGGTAQATVNATVNPINDDPVANDDTFTTDEDMPFSATLGLDDLLLNDSDLDGDSLTVNTTPVSGPTNGSVVLNSDGTFTYTPNLNFNGSDSFVYEVSDGNGGTAQATVNVTVNPINDNPVANVDAFTTDEDTPFSATLGLDDLLLNDSDLDGDSLTVNTTPVSGPTNGLVVLNSDGTFTYTPNLNFNGSDSFVYEVSDGNGGTAQATVNVTVNPINDNPVANVDAFTTDEDMPFSATLGLDDLLLNDSDLDGDSLTVNTTPVSGPTNGLVVLNSDGTFTYTPNLNFNGSDSFVYEVFDGNGGTAQATVNVTVNPINDNPVANVDAFTTDEDTPFSATLGLDDLLLNDSDLDGDSLTVNTTPISGPSNGTLVLNSDGTFTYTPNLNFNGSDSFVYEVSDGNGGTAQATVTITVNPINDDPVANDDGFTTDEDTPFSATLGLDDLLLNDSDLDGDSLTVNTTPVSGPTNGLVVLNSDGTFTYTPNLNFNGSDSFVYEVFDGNGGTAQATVNVTVNSINDNPVANVDAFTTDEDTPFSATLGLDDLLLNDSDLDGDSLTVNTTPVSGPTNGSVVLNSDGTFTYTPSLNFNGSDSFVYEVSDGNGGTAQATVNVTVNSINDNPVANVDAFTTDEDAPFSATLGLDDLLLNDSDLDGDSLTVNTTPVSGPTNGLVVLNSDGTFTYTPNLNFNGSDSFVYEVSDGNGGTAQATVNVTVNPINDNPVANVDAFTTDEDTPFSATLGLDDLLLNDSDLDGDSLTVNTTPVSGPTNGSVVLNSDGTFTYTPSLNFNGSDSFVYEVSDGNGGTAQATVNVTVNSINDNPVANVDAFTTDEDAPYSATLGLDDLLLNDSDLDGDSLTVNTTPVSGPTNGSVVLSSDGTFTYTPSLNFNGSDSFVYEVSDGNGGTAQATVDVTVNPINDNPVANVDAFTTDEDTPFSATLGLDDLLLNDSDLDGDSLTVNTTPVSGPTNGAVVLSSDGTFTYTPNLNFNGSDSFVYEVSDGNGGTAQATVTITVNSINDDPVANADVFTTDEDTPFSATLSVNDLLLNDSDLDGDSLTVNTTPVSGPTNGAVVLISDGTFTYTPILNFNGTDSFVYAVSDGNGGTAQATVNITVNPINDAPLADNDVYVVSEGGTITVASLSGVLVNDTDIDGDTLTAVLTASPMNGSVSLNPDGSFTYVHDGTETASDLFTYEIGDGNGGTSTGVVNITVIPVNDAPVFHDDPNVTVNENQVFVFSSPAVDSDLGQTLAYSISGGADAVLFTINSSTGSLNFLSPPDFESPADTDFDNKYEVEIMAHDGLVGTTRMHAVTVVNVNEAPDANDDHFSLEEDVVLTATGFGVVVNDSDVEDDPLGTDLVSAPSNGTVTWNDDGTFTYTPNDDFFGTDSFVYRTTDGEFEDFATVTIEVTPVNDAPTLSVETLDGFIVVGDVLSVTESLLQYGEDVDLDDLALEIVQQPENGVLTVNPDGTFEFEPDSSFSGTVQFQFVVSDGLATSDAATATIEVVSFVGNGIDDGDGDSGGTDDGSNESGTDDELIALPPVLVDHDDDDDDVEALFDFLSRSTSDTTQLTSSNVETVEYDGVNPTPGNTVFYASVKYYLSDVASFGAQLQEVVDAGRQDLSTIAQAFNFDDVVFGQALDSLNDAIKLEFPFEFVTLGATIATTGGMSVGYVLWTIRGGYLIGGLLSSQMPAWKMIDPLPIVDFLGNEDEEDHNSLETIIATAKS